MEKSGAFALEGISRGIKQVCMIDVNTQNLKKNVALFPQEQSKIKIIQSDVHKLPIAPQKYDILFMDAPYNQGLSEVALKNIHQQKWLKNKAICLVEVEKNEQLIIPSCYKFINERIYGIAKVIFLEYNSSDGEA